MKTSYGVPVGGVFGFIRTLLSLIEKHKVQNIIIAMDSGKKTFRNEIFTQYKANRTETPTNLIPQFGILNEFLKSAQIPHIQKDGFEADDVIASIVEKHKKEKKLTIVTSDKDLMQLVCDQVECLDFFKDKFFHYQDVIEKFGVKPEYIVDYLALVGDASDNIPGVKGCGKQGAAKLINQFGNFENILANIENIPNGKLKEALSKYSKDGILSKRLASLNYSVPLEENQTFVMENIDFPAIGSFLEKYEMKSLINLMNKVFKNLNKEVLIEEAKKENIQFQLI